MARQEFKTGATRFETLNGVFLEGEHESASGKVFLLTTRDQSGNLDALVRLKNDYEFTANIDVDGVLKGIKLLRTDRGIVVLKQYFDGIVLHRYINAVDFSVPNFLKLAINLTTVLRDLHDRDIILKDCSPFNFLISPDTLKIVVCSLGSATNLLQEQSELRKGELDLGNLAYISPEETGRLGRSLDYRADFYSLGVMLYEMICKRRPFSSQDPVELVHAHIAKIPIEPHRLVDDLPPALSAIVMKLLAKNPEDRYQSARGLLRDLEKARKQWISNGHISNFKVGEEDSSKIFRISEKLYGRDAEITRLTAGLERTYHGKSELMLVSGYSGIGKTRLIQEIQRPIVANKGFFVMGKFDQYNRDLPFIAFTQAMTSLVNQTMTGSRHEVDYWRQEIQAALGSNGALLIDLIPSLEQLIGPQPEVHDIGSAEAKERFNKLILDFLAVFERSGRPLVIFMDDLQWATDYLGLLDQIMRSDLTHLLMIGAYRDNEVHMSHPLMMAISELKNEMPERVHEIHLNKLTPDDINQLVADSTRSTVEHTHELSNLIYAKTDGNPFFVTQFVSTLVNDKLIFFDDDKREWSWVTESISSLDITENVVDLVVAQINKLPKEVRTVISLAACFGNRFDLSTLAIISGHSESECSRILWKAIRQNLIVPLGSDWVPYYQDEMWNEIGLSEFDNYHTFKFQHDRIQQAAYSLIPSEELDSTHLRIGRLLLEQAKTDKSLLDEYQFDILNHLNFARNLIEDTSEQQDIAKLNYIGGLRAMRSNAIVQAVRYFTTGMVYLKDQQSLDLFKKLLISRSECEYLSGNYQESETLFDTALENARDNLDKADILSRKMALYENTQRHEKAIDAAQQGLAYLDIKLPASPGNLGVMRELIKVKFLLRNKSPEDLLERRNMESPQLLLAMQILMNLWGPVYLLQKQDLLAYKILRMVNMSVRHGNSKESGLAYAFYGYVMSAQLGDYKGAFAFSRLGNKLNAKLNDTSLRSKTHVIADGCVAHYGMPFREILPNLQIAFDAGVQHNDIIYAGYAVTFLNRARFFMGESLQHVYAKCEKYIHFVRQTQSAISLHQLLPWAKFQARLLGKDLKPELFQDMADDQSHVRFIEDWAREKITLPKANYHIAKCMEHYLFNEFEQARSHAAQAEPVMDSVPGLPESSEHTIYQALAIAACIRESGSVAMSDKKKFRKNLKRVETWAKYAPSNYEPRFLLLSAIAKLQRGDNFGAIENFVKAAESARKYQQTHTSAIAHERLAELYANQDNSEGVKKHVVRAYQDYVVWGAQTKAEQLSAKYPEQLTPLAKTSGDRVVSDMPVVSKLTSSSIDLQSILKAAESISKEVVLDRLFGQILKIIIENAGAQSAHIVIVRGHDLIVEARSRANDEFTPQFNRQPIHDASDLSRSIVQYVYNSVQPVILDDAASNPNYAGDQYVQANQVRSVLCWPLEQSGTCIAVFYLENNLIPKAFTPDRVETLKLLSGQLAVSIENALLVENLEQKVLERTQALEQEKQKSDDLLLNILPSEIADELKQKGNYNPTKHKSVTILFTDFEQFTSFSASLSAEEVVEMIDHTYKAFDKICARLKIEKIKTIGDSYMCVAGLKKSDENHAEQAIAAAMEMMDFIESYNAERIARGQLICPMRIGMHTGSVVAGVVGHHKFAYDIWGDAVNTAFRMQSASLPGKINISRTTYNLVTDKISVESRGEVAIKNRGSIEMFYVERPMNG